MRTAWIIAVREVREKTRLFLICAALAVVPFAATFLPGARASAELTIAVTGGFLATILGLGIAATTGASTIARDLSEKRMSFYFTKPVSATALWVGKASASLFISLACAAIIAVPAMLASRKQWVLHWLGQMEPLNALAVAIVVMFFIAHALSSVIRSRSPLLALDFLFLIVAAGSLYLMFVPLVMGAAVKLIAVLSFVIAASFLLVLMIAPVWQLANGRSDIRRSHAALMRFLWPAVGIVLLTVGGLVWWVVHVSPQDIDVGYAEQPPRGSLLVVFGPARNRFDYQAGFLMDSATGKFERIAAPTWWNAQFSKDGRVAIWQEGYDLRTNLGPTGIRFPRGTEALLSDDGTRLALVRGNVVAVHDLSSGAILASGGGLDFAARQQLFFATPDIVRVIEQRQISGQETPLRIFELDVRARTMRKTGERMVLGSGTPVSVSGDGSRMLLNAVDVIADARTGETIAQIAGALSWSQEMLHDGRVALMLREGGMPRLRLYDRDGTLRHVVPFPGARVVWIAAETENGKLILAGHGKTMYVVDLASGVVERKLEGLHGPVPRWSVDPRLIRFAADQELVSVDAKGNLVTWKSEGRVGVRPLLPSR